MGSCYSSYIGLDVQKETIAVWVARSGRDVVKSRLEIVSRPKQAADDCGNCPGIDCCPREI
jgi:hypothetical protein